MLFRARFVSSALIAAFLATALWSPSVSADGRVAAVSKTRKETRTKKAEKEKTASIGAPNAGRLTGAARLRSSRSVLVRKRAEAWALPDLVKLIERATAHVKKKRGGGTVLVGDLSAKQGGALAGHNSHQSGRDADLGFYVTNSKGKPFALKRFLAFGDDGKGTDVTWTRFDDARNWAFVEALLTDKQTHVRYIFISNGLRARLLAYGKEHGASKAVLTRAAFALLSPTGVDVHDDHFHIRIACPESMRGTCIEESSARGGGSSEDADAPAPNAKTPSKTAPSKSEPEKSEPVDAPEPPSDASAEPEPS